MKILEWKGCKPKLFLHIWYCPNCWSSFGESLWYDALAVSDELVRFWHMWSNFQDHSGKIGQICCIYGRSRATSLWIKISASNLVWGFYQIWSWYLLSMPYNSHSDTTWKVGGGSRRCNILYRSWKCPCQSQISHYYIEKHIKFQTTLWHKIIWHVPMLVLQAISSSEASILKTKYPLATCC